jgi:hypothetical protein
VKTQVWCAMVAYVLIPLKKKRQLDALLYTCLQTFSASVLKKIRGLMPPPCCQRRNT